MFIDRWFLQGRQLAVEQCGRHEMTAALGQSLADELRRPLEVDQDHLRPIADEDVAIAAFQGRAGHDARLAVRPPIVNPLRDASQPGQAVGIGERRAALHLLDVFGRMQRIAFLVGPAQFRGQPRRDRGLAAAGDAHHHHDHRPVVSCMLVH